MLEKGMSFIAENKDTILMLAIGGSLLSFLLRGIKKLASLALSAVLFVTILQSGQALVQNINLSEEQIESLVDNANTIIEEVEDSTGFSLQKLLDSLGISEWLDKHGELGESEPVSAMPITGDAKVHYIDVGQADCIFIEDGEDTVLIDCGNYADAEVVTEYISGLGVEQIDYFIATHPHEDHIGCAGIVLNTFDVDTLIKSDVDNDTVCYKKMMEAAEKNGTEIVIAEPGQEYALENSTLQILGPVYIDENELNNCSVVAKYVYGDTSFLFTGDAEKEEEKSILDAGMDIKADVLKVGHHGSSTSSSYIWLREVQPQYGVICVGEGNSYGHPHKESMSRFRDADMELYRTDKNGTIVFVTDGSQYQVYTEK